MSKKRKRSPAPAILLGKEKLENSRELQNERQELMMNGLGEAVFGGSFGPGTRGFGTQLNQVDTLFANNRVLLISNLRQVLSQTYVEHGLIQTLIDVPVNDAFRHGVTFKSKQLSPEQLEQLHAEFKREDILGAAVGQACKWNRLFGGAGIVILTGQDPASPLDLSLLTEDSPLDFRAVDMWELFWDKQNVEGFNPAVSEPAFDHYDYYGVKLHKSRVMKMKGLTAPSFVRPRLRGWGFSIVEALVNSINQYLKANNLVFEVLDEFKVDVFGIAGLSDTLESKGGQEKVRQRIQIANGEKNYNHALTMDALDTYNQKQLSFSGLADVYREIRMQIASDMRMPITKLFGVSSAGFSSGEDDIENYNGMVESDVRAKSHPEIVKIAELKCQRNWGFVPTDLEAEFKPLRVLGAEAEQNVKDKIFNRLLAARSAGEIDHKLFAEGCNKENLLPVQLDPSVDTLDDLEEDEDEEGDDDKPADKPGKGKGETK